MKNEERQKARILRSEGLPINEIASKLNVSKSSVSIWARDIVLTENQIKELQMKNPIFNIQLCGAKSRADQARAKRLSYQEEGKEKAKERNLLHQAGCLLYWAEGSKEKNVCSMVNSDVYLLKLFKKFLVEHFKITKEDCTISINYYTNNGLSKEDIENYWLANLELDSKCLRKGQENNRPRSSTGKERHNKLPYGMCTLKVLKSTSIVQHIYGAIQQYAGFNNDYMLM